MRPISVLIGLACASSLIASGAPDRSNISTYLARVPLAFEKTSGAAVDQSAAWVGRGYGYTVALGATSATIVPSAHGRSDTVRVQFLNARPEADSKPLEPLPGRTNYLIGTNPERWIQNLPNYGRIEYRNVYRGIDVAWYGNQGQIEYDFIIQPGADANRIRMNIQGARKLALTPKGDLEIETASGTLKLQLPRIYQDTAGVRETVQGGYVLEARNVIGLKLGGYDKRRPLVIDPTLAYGSFLGNGFNVSAVTTDSLGDVYVAGTASAGLPTVNALQPGDLSSDNTNCFLMKLDPTGTAVVYSTYIGGSTNYSQVGGIGVDSNGELAVTGTTAAKDFPLLNAAWTTFDVTHNQSAFALKLSANGSSFVYSTYLGSVAGFAVALDAAGNAYLAGDSYATTMATSGAWETVYGGGYNDAFVAKLGPAGALIYFTFLGGSGYDQGTALAVDSLGNAYVGGYTDSLSFPNNPPGARTANAGGYDAFIAEVSADGSSVPWLTFLGGAGHDTLSALVCDSSSGIVYVAGTTSSTNLPTTTGVVQPSANGPSQGYVASVNSDGMSFGFVTYLGGRKDDAINGLTLTPTGQLAVAGTSSSYDLASINAIQPAFIGNGVSFFASANSGATWTPDDAGLPASVFTVTGDPSNPSTLLAVSGSPFSVFRTTNGGASWLAEPLVGNVWFDFSPPAFIRSPANPAVVYVYQSVASAPNNIFAFRSTDSGATWTALANPTAGALFSDYLEGLALSSTDANTLVEIFYSGAVYRSSDGGASFNALSSLAYPCGSVFPIGSALTSSPDGSFYLATYNGICKSTDDGSSWSPLAGTGSFGYPGTAIAVSPSTPSVVYILAQSGTVYQSTNSGATWTAETSPGGSVNMLAVAPSNSQVVYAAGSGGVFVSTNGAATWSPAAGLPFAPSTIAVNPSNPAAVYAGGTSATDGFLAKLNTAGTNLIWSTFYTGSNGANPAAIASVASGDVWIGGTTSSTDLPITANASGNLGGNSFLARISDTTAACSYSLNPPSLVSYGAQTLTFAVTAPSGCAWTATPSDSTWITVNGSGLGTASGVVSVTLAANNTSSTRTGSISVSGQTFAITQASASCTYSATTPATVPDSGGTVVITVTAPAGCPWGVTSQSPGVTVLSGGAGTGNGSVTLTVSPNPTVSAVSSTVTVGTKNITVTQADECTYTVSPASTGFAPVGGTGSVSVTASPAGCAWTATSNQGWLTVTSGSSGVGNGTVSFTAASNSGGSRGATLTVAGQTVPVSQIGAFLISTIAGGQMPATAVAGPLTSLGNTQAIAVDSGGNAYFSTSIPPAVFRLDTAGILSRVAGGAAQGYSGDGGPALNAQLNNPFGVAVDSAGNVYIADVQNNRIRKVDTSGNISTVAGSGVGGFGGDGSQATSAELNSPNGVAVDSKGNLYIADTNNYRIREVSANGTIATVAGNGTSGYTGDNAPATSAEIGSVYGIAVDGAGNVYIADGSRSVIRELSGGVITTIAGSGISGYAGDGGPAITAKLDRPFGVAVDGAGNVYIADELNNRIRVVSNGTISTLAGNGVLGYSGDGGPATLAQLFEPEGVAADPFGNLYVADNFNQRIRKVSSGTITTAAGGATGDSGPAPLAGFNSPIAVVHDSGGNLYIADIHNNRVRKITPAGIVTTVAGTGISGYSGDNGPAISAQLYWPEALALDALGNLYIADNENSRVRMVSTDGTISTVAGNGSFSYSGDGGPATSASISGPRGLALDTAGNLYISDTLNNRIRVVSPSGTIATFAGTGVRGYSGDNGPATSAQLANPIGVTVDSSGNLYIADNNNHRIRKVSSSGTITSVAGNGTNGHSGDNGPATSAELSFPQGVAADASGNLYIADTGNSRIRVVVPAGTIATIAGTGSANYSGDGGPASNATFFDPSGLAVDASGNVYVADSENNVLRMLSPVGGPPLLTGASTHTGSFTPGSSGQYTLTITNAALAGPTSGTVTVTDIVPPGLTITGMSGPNWTCGTNSCTRSDSHTGGQSYDAITVSVSVAAPAPIQLTNQVTVSGGGGFITGAEDLTVIGGAVPPQPALAGPAAGTTQDSLSVTLSWSTGLGIATIGTTSYNVYFGTTLPLTLVGTTTATSYTVTGLQPGTTYYWQVQANNGEHTASSAVQSLGTISASAACQVTQDSTASMADVQRIVNEALGVAQPMNDITGDGAVTVADIQIVANAAAGRGCTLM